MSAAEHAAEHAAMQQIMSFKHAPCDMMTDSAEDAMTPPSEWVELDEAEEYQDDGT